jgi:hypothetical protein
MEGCAVLSKCANPECSEQFRFLHEGKIFHLTPTLEVQEMSEDAFPSLYERFWLCDRCSTKMTLIWAGTHAKLVPLPAAPVAMPAVLAGKVVARKRSTKRAANTASRNR